MFGLTVCLIVALSVLLNSQLRADPCLAPAFIAALAGDAVLPSSESVVTGDFNRDGKPDVAAVSPIGVTIQLAEGNGAFQDPTNYPVTGTPHSVAAGDLNGDGKVDLAVAASDDLGGFGRVSTLLGNGDGTFHAGKNYPVGKDPRAVAMGDFNGDGALDLAVANAESRSLSILLGKGDGSFAPAVTYAAGTNAFSLVVADFNRDGKSDILIANRSFAAAINGSLSLFLGKGDGTFQPAIHYSAPLNPRMVAADFNGDGQPDLALANYNALSVSILLGNGDGTFRNPVNYSAGGFPYSLALGDFDRDGHVDIAVSTVSPGDVRVMSGRGDGTFVITGNYKVGFNTTLLAVEDFNGDGRTDLLAGGSLLLGQGDGTFLDAAYYAAGLRPESATSGQFNGDSQADLVVANFGTFESDVAGSVSVLLSRGDGTFKNAVDYGAGEHPTSVAVCDLDGDGRPDLAVAHLGAYDSHTGAYSINSGVSVLLASSDGTFKSAANYPAGDGPRSVAIGDFNGDGKADLAVVNYNSGNVSILLNNADGTFRGAVNYSAADGLSFLALGDFNADGKLDLAVASETANNVSVLLGKGDGTFEPPRHYTTGRGSSGVAVGDFNGDGHADLAVANPGSNNFSILLGRGEGTFATALNYAAGTGGASLAVGDFNHDGKPDLALGPDLDGIVRIVLGRGDGTFESALMLRVLAIGGSVAVADLDGDGGQDLVVSTIEGVAVLRQICPSTNRDLEIARQAGGLIVTWPLADTGLVFESTTNLNHPNWQPAAELPSAQNGRWEVTVQADLPQRYFRWRKP